MNRASLVCTNASSGSWDIVLNHALKFVMQAGPYPIAFFSVKLVVNSKSVTLTGHSLIIEIHLFCTRRSTYISAQASAAKVEAALEGLESTGDLSVSRTLNDGNGYDWQVCRPSKVVTHGRSSLLCRLSSNCA